MFLLLRFRLGYFLVSRPSGIAQYTLLLSQSLT